MLTEPHTRQHFIAFLVIFWFFFFLQLTDAAWWETCIYITLYGRIHTQINIFFLKIILVILRYNVIYYRRHLHFMVQAKNSLFRFHRPSSYLFTGLPTGLCPIGYSIKISNMERESHYSTKEEELCRGELKARHVNIIYLRDKLLNRIIERLKINETNILILLFF